MVYTMNVIDGKIEVPKPWRNKKKVIIRKSKSQYIIDFDEDFSEDNIEYTESKDGENMHLHFKNGIRAGELYEHLKKEIL